MNTFYPHYHSNYAPGDQTHLYCSFCKTNLYSYTQTVCEKCHLNLEQPGMVIFTNQLQQELPYFKKVELSLKSFFSNLSNMCKC